MEEKDAGLDLSRSVVVLQVLDNSIFECIFECTVNFRMVTVCFLAESEMVGTMFLVSCPF
jgi:hypothetical protein